MVANRMKGRWVQRAGVRGAGARVDALDFGRGASVEDLDRAGMCEEDVGRLEIACERSRRAEVRREAGGGRRQNYHARSEA